MKLSREQAEVFADNPNVRRLLTAIQAAEGTHGHANPYAVGFGHRPIDDLSQHPQRRVGFTDLTGKRGVTSAAGAYQIVTPTWQRAANALGLKDFGPRNQDLAAVYLIAGRGALQDAVRGDYSAAVSKLGEEWASLPSSRAAQPKRTQAFMEKWLGRDSPAVPAPSPPPPATAELPTYTVPFAAPYAQAPFGQPYPQRATAPSAVSPFAPIPPSALPTMPVYGRAALPALHVADDLADDLAQLRRPYRLSE